MRKAHVLISVFLLLCFSLAAFADVVVRKDGTVHRGDIIYKDAQIVILKTGRWGQGRAQAGRPQPRRGGRTDRRRHKGPVEGFRGYYRGRCAVLGTGG